MSFVALPPEADLEPTPENEPTITNDGFFPDIDPLAVRAAQRVPSSITAARLRAAILGAMMTARIDLVAFAASAQAAGHARLQDMPGPQLDGISIRVLAYSRAIGLYAKAELIERHRDFDTTNAGANQASELEGSIGELRRDAQHALRDLKGIGRTIVDLI
ncbi:head completion/stabilization protein [Sphingobium yanoikuyae]|uniref:Head completion/stabilization protein n=1 Tax=Sphingobium yanoikuyae TaxID=13690 RepID=A0A430BB90_SPHYA|nr:head completion/stabilization protein [Sphingobium yanoikuyae]RSU45826.1 head completion/stabilization protein [Sphingobium yanoikuyae]